MTNTERHITTAEFTELWRGLDKSQRETVQGFAIRNALARLNKKYAPPSHLTIAGARANGHRPYTTREIVQSVDFGSGLVNSDNELYPTKREWQIAGADFLRTLIDAR